jgi:14-3-3 protein epsilon
MSTERDVALFMAQVLDQTDRSEDMISFMKLAIELNPVLTEDERNLLAVGYKNLITPRRHGLQTLSALNGHTDGQSSGSRIREIAEIRAKLSRELQEIAQELIGLVTDKLLPAATTPEAKIFFEKLRADYYRYVCESLTGTERDEVAEKAKGCYAAALDIAKTALKPASPGRLSLVLNYAVFLNETLRAYPEALELAKTTYADCSVSMQELTEEQIAETSMLLDVLRENISNWGARVQ